jgi:carbon storage regulator
MLVLSRKINERIQIGDEITITVVRMSAGSVRIGIEAPAHLAILREELAAGQYEASQSVPVESSAVR